MTGTKTTIALISAFVMGMAATSMMSGCQQADQTWTAAPTSTTVSESSTSTQAAAPPVTESTSLPEIAAVASTDAPKTTSPSPNSGVEPGTRVEPGDWKQWGGNSYRNNVPVTDANVPTSWDVGEFDGKTGAWDKSSAKNILWMANLGSQTYGNAVVADSRIFVGTNNGAGYLKRYPNDVDLGCLIALNESNGSFLWQHSSEKLSTGRVHDWPLQGICCAPLVEGEKLWFVTSRGEVVCLDTKGYYDDKDDGVPAKWGRLFDMGPSQENVGEDLAALKTGKLTDSLRQRFQAAGAELNGDLTVSANSETEFALTGKVGDQERKFELRKARSGPNWSVFKLITAADKEEADEIWVYNMMSGLGVSQHNMCSCSVTALGDVLFVNTSNGLDESHINLPAPDAPSFIAMDKNTGKVLWTDKSPGANILHGQWSSPAVGVINGTPQAIFGGGDGWVYSFRADKGQDGKPELLWKFDANPKTSKWILGGRGTRNNIIATPVIHDGLVYVAVGQDPEHGEGVGHLWCIDPNKRGDVGPELALRVEGDKRVPIPHRRLQAVIEENSEVAVDNPNSAVVWHYSQVDQDGNGKIDFEEIMHRSCGTVAIKNNLLFISDFSGLFHCLDAKTGKVHWTHDMLAAAWGSPLIVNGHVFIGDEDGDVSVFKLSAEKHDPIEEIIMDSSVYSTPIVANGVLYLATKNRLYAIGTSEKQANAEKSDTKQAVGSE